MKTTSASGAPDRKKKAIRFIERNRHRDALPLLEKACRDSPGDGEAWLMLGAVHGFLGNMPAAIRCTERAADILPTSIQCLDNLALAYQNSGAIEKACDTWKRRLALTPLHRDTVNRLAQGLVVSGQAGQAIESYRLFLAANPHDYQFYTNLGAVYEYVGNLDQAKHCYSRVLELRPGLSIALQGVANVLCAQGRIQEAGAFYRKALEANPGDAIARSNYLLTLNYKPDSDADEVYREHLRLMPPSSEGDGGRTFPNELTPSRPLRIGFVSPDMRTHSVAYFFEPLLESLDRKDCTCFCYADVANADEITTRLRALSDGWCDITKLDMVAIRNRIREDSIDILVDLAGHTSARNMVIFAARSAPIQLTWLGYPNTTGLQCMDYRITDEHADPVDEGTPGTEELLRLKAGFLCYKAPLNAPEVNPLPATNKGYITFGSFNNLAKVNDRVLALWACLLAQVPHSRLYLKNPSFTDGATCQAFAEKLGDLGVAPDRVTLVGRTPTTQEHLGCYGEIDIALDTFPYNGTTTTCEALWMGVPVVAMVGHVHAARVGASLLAAANHPEWLARDEDAYLRIAAGLASDLTALASLRGGLRRELAGSVLCDAKGFAAGFMRAMRAAWEKNVQHHTQAAR